MENRDNRVTNFAEALLFIRHMELNYLKSVRGEPP